MAAEFTFFIPTISINKEIRKSCAAQILLKAEISGNTHTHTDKRNYQLKKNSNIRKKKNVVKWGHPSQTAACL